MALSASLSASHVGTFGEWRARAAALGARSARGAARAYARANGFAVVMRADDGADCFALDHESGNVREWSKPARKCEWR